MTREEFIRQGWTGQMKAKVNRIIYDVVNVDFDLFTVGLNIDGVLTEINCEHVTIIDEQFKLWDGDYEKQHYDVMIEDGTIYKHCWPNAGEMRFSNKSWSPKDKIKVRVSSTHPMDINEDKLC